MSTVQALAPAKLNLFLHVTGQKSNGYHLLQSLFTRIDLSDTLSFTLRSDGQILRVNEITDIAYEQDLTIRAAQLLQKHTGTSQGVEIALLKRIPSGAGLGGGSSDAATTLMVLNRLWNTGLTKQALIELGVQLGADVPFFLFGETAIAEGIGEELYAFPLVPLYYLVLRPDLSIPTPLIFKSSDLVRNSPRFNQEELAKGKVLIEQGQFFARNDLEPVALRLFPDLNVLIQRLRKYGFNFRMTGSGSCFFMPFTDEAKAQETKDRVAHFLATQEKDLLSVSALFVVKSL